MTVTHPVALRDSRSAPGAVTFGATTYSIGADGTVDCPADVEAALADHLAEHYGVSRDDIYEEDGPPDDEGEDSETETLLDVDPGESAPADVGEWADWSESDWFEMDWRQREEDVREGRVDDHLEEIADSETSANVQEAAEERLAELED